ncbi:hypothetical protein G6F62_000364 [Rhizopus arrhizus]|nr:hypothetical protein G6F23_000893 [Rhizopus arrhizus]KAG0792589.1 hypothetical protein G6F21_004243 [Rhizopus arrhizus]KAG0815138.1 hypothetical protein G6F20_004223 [Rhizopus arrhizus]KAG0833689.1 hypothetical protein G6F19_005562 [Rhizopus arrhizus]KAG0839414.1 hypothetical protein G6F18_004126 [Rhizopus arrhizus]
MSTTMSAIVPSHSELDTLNKFEKLKRLCPAFSKGCPYSDLEELNSLAVNRGEASRCPAFMQGCPFSSRSKEEITELMIQIPKDHPILTIPELPSCDEGVTLVESLNQFLQKSQFEQDQQQKITGTQSDILENPQLASAMREGTKVVHKAAETSVFTKRFLRGVISADEYGRYINSLYFVYLYMESLLEEYKDHPAVKLIYFPRELNRKETLEKDLAFFYGPERAAALANPQTMTPAVKSYVKAMKDACNVNPALLIAHSYSRYLGDLSGGQILSKRLKKHILHYDDTTWDSSEGLNFYYFNNLGNQAEFKNFYRERLDSAKVNAVTRDLIVTEAVKSFELNIALFDEIQDLSDAGKLEVTSFKPQNDMFTTPKEKASIRNDRLSHIHWLTVAAATVAVGAVIHHRFLK